MRYKSVTLRVTFTRQVVIDILFLQSFQGTTLQKLYLGENAFRRVPKFLPLRINLLELYNNEVSDLQRNFVF